MKHIATAVAAILCLTNGTAQMKNAIVSGPMPGHTDMRTANVWVQFEKGIMSAAISFRPANQPKAKLRVVRLSLKGDDYNTAVFTLNRLEQGTTYKYYVSAGNENKFIDSGSVTTQALWQSRNSPPDFSFLTGSCAYFNEPAYDRTGTPYGKDSSIFETMAKEKAAFMLWLGDNWYTRFGDYDSESGLYYRASRDRSLPVLKNFLSAMPHYAIWDDHDYGPNDANKSYHLKESSRKVFKDYWVNPSYGLKDEGIFTTFTWNDVQFFLLDARWFRSSDRMKDSVNGKINPQKEMFGDLQMDWLKNSLLHSNGMGSVRFRIIVTGSQVLNTFSRWDSFRSYPAEYYDFLSFLEENRIEGVLFLTGDRHHSEIIKMERKDAYPLYDVTVSPLTSSPAKTSGAEENNPDRVGKEVDEQNYGRITISGEGEERRLTVELVSKEGETLETWSVLAGELKF